MRTRVALGSVIITVGPMKRWSRGFLAVCLALGLISLDGAEGALRASKSEVRKEVVAAIEGQLAAFRAGDTKAAYLFAAATLRAQNPLRQFSRIVEVNYPEIWANSRADFGLVHDDGMRATVLVQVWAKDVRADYDYGLAKERDGWRIDRVLRHAPKDQKKI